MLDSTKRFSDRVANYVRFRPSYPPALFHALRQRGVLAPSTCVADVGAGTGILTGLLLPQARSVVAVEPNAEMRAACDEQFARTPGYSSVGGTAEATTLRDQSIHLVTAAQAFHWFDATACRREFARILYPGGFVALAWNERRADTRFLAGYDALLRKQESDYDQLKHRRIDQAVIAAFFAPCSHELIETPNEQVFDFDGLAGRALSSSYVPNSTQPGHREFMVSLRTLFDQHAEHGHVVFHYVTRVFLGQLSQPGTAS